MINDCFTVWKYRFCMVLPLADNHNINVILSLFPLHHPLVGREEWRDREEQEVENMICIAAKD